MGELFSSWGHWWEAGAVLVSLCALFLTIQSNRGMKEHNRLSVKPRLTTSTFKNLVMDGDTRALKVQVTLSNVGLGPAVVKSWEIFLDGMPAQVDSSEDVRTLLQRAAPVIQLGPTLSYMKLNKGSALAVGATIEIVACTILNPSQDINKQLERFTIRVCYESLYEQSFTYDSRDHLES